MGLVYKFDVLAALSANGYSTYRLRKEKLLGEGTLQKLRRGEGVSWDVVDTLCGLLGCQPGDLMEYVEEEKPEA